MDYSVLISVYAKENPEYLRTALDSMLKQSAPPSQVVLVCDGPLTPELNGVIGSYGSLLDVVRLPENKGPGNARAEGLKRCRCELVAGMDSDDISVPDRCEKQLAAFAENSGLAVVSGTIEEFDDDPEKPFAKRVLPAEHEKIKEFSKKRIPFNNVTVMFKKSVIEGVGGYDRCRRLFEDYDLWIRVLKSGAVTANLPDTMVKVRTTAAQVKRRGGLNYGRQMVRFRREMMKTGWISRKEYVFTAYPHFIVCMMPNCARKLIYKFLRG